MDETEWTTLEPTQTAHLYAPDLQCKFLHVSICFGLDFHHSHVYSKLLIGLLFINHKVIILLFVELR